MVRDPFGIQHERERNGQTLVGVWTGEDGCEEKIATVEVGRLHTPQPNTFKLSISQILTFNPSRNALSLGQLGSPLDFKNVKCQNNNRENYLFQLLFLSSHFQWVRSLHTFN